MIYVRLQNSTRTHLFQSGLPAVVDWCADRPYYDATWRHLSDGVHPATLASVPEGHRVTSESWELVDGVAVQSVETEAIPAPPLYDASTWAGIAPLLADHPVAGDVPESGMFYRVPDPEDASVQRLFWWRQGDAAATQLSAHDRHGDPVIRTFNGNTRTETTISITAIQRAANIALAPVLADMTDAEVLERIDLFPEWRPGVRLEAGERVRHSSKLYKVVQTHATQADWAPGSTPALFTEVAPPDVVPAWRQPTGAHDAYAVGDRVTHNGVLYESNIPANTTEPGTDGTFHRWWRVV